MFDFHKNHKNLTQVAFLVFAILSTLVAIVPAYQMQETQALPSMKPMSEQEKNGLAVYTSENCMSCHTQQVRNIEMDKTWGERPSIPSDYYYSKMRPDIWRQSPSLLGSERTGPDLTNIGKRQPGLEWHLLHLYNPRIVIAESIMPAYPWLFVEKESHEVQENDIVLPVPEPYAKGKKIVATQKVLDLVTYLQSLKQAELNPQGNKPDFIPSSKLKSSEENASLLPNGANLYMENCAACHQADGKGLNGAFPPLANSKIVLDENPELLIQIILKGYDARAEFSVMPGFEEQLTDEEIAAIATHERSNWGNDAKAVTAEEVKKIRTYMNTLNP